VRLGSHPLKSRGILLTSEQAATVGIKLLGLSLAVGALTQLVGTVSMSSGSDLSPELRASIWGHTVGGAATLAMGVILVAWGRGLARVLFRFRADSGNSTSHTQLLSVGLAVLGCYLVVTAAPELLRLALDFRITGASDYAYNKELFWQRSWVSVAAETLRLVLGVGLFAGARPLAALWRRLRPLNNS